MPCLLRWRFALLACMLLLVCGGCGERSSAPVTLFSEFEPIKFTCPAGWYENPEENSFDLQGISPSQDLTIGVFVFNNSDLGAEQVPIDLLWEQIESLKTSRPNFEKFEWIEEQAYDDKVITSITYKGDTSERDSMRCCYRFSLIEFLPDEKHFAIALQVAEPRDWDKSKFVFDRIVRSAKLLSRSTAAPTPRP